MPETVSAIVVLFMIALFFIALTGGDFEIAGARMPKVSGASRLIALVVLGVMMIVLVAIWRVPPNTGAGPIGEQSPLPPDIPTITQNPLQIGPPSNK
jgi:hypothetical protein